MGDKMLERVENYIKDKDFRFTVYENKIHIINYKRIITLEEDTIYLQSQNKKIRMIGTNFILKKIVDNEMLIVGNISKIEVEND